MFMICLNNRIIHESHDPVTTLEGPTHILDIKCLQEFLTTGSFAKVSLNVKVHLNMK